jgi:hypothetical protein
LKALGATLDSFVAADSDSNDADIHGAVEAKAAQLSKKEFRFSTTENAAVGQNRPEPASGDNLDRPPAWEF